MNRRSFFSSLAKSAAVAIVAPNIIASVQPDRMRWRKATPESNIYCRPNPAWVNAPYEVVWFTIPFPEVMEGTIIKPVIFRRDLDRPDQYVPPPHFRGVRVKGPCPFRLDEIGTVVSPVI